MKIVYPRLKINTRRKFIKNGSLATIGIYFLPKVQGNMLVTAERPNNFTRYGCLFEGLTAEESDPLTLEAGFDLTRVPVFYSRDSANVDKILKHVKQGVSVQINLDWQGGPIPIPYPKDIPELIKRIAEVLHGFDESPYKDLIPFICIENEWDNIAYHSNRIKYYIDELYAVTALCHRHGVKVADAGITSTSLRRWMYSQLSGTEAQIWKTQYWVGKDQPNYLPLLARVELYIERIQDVPIDYLNVHWYNIEGCFGGFPKAAGTYLARCGKNEIITNEFGQQRQSFELWQRTVNEVSSYDTPEGRKFTRYAIAYSGTNQPDKAVQLTPDMLKLLANPTSPTIADQQPKIIKADNLVYPNPAKDYFIVNPALFKNTENKILSVTNSSGKTMLQQKLSGSGAQRISLPGHIQKGVYIVSVVTGKEIYQQNLVVE